MSSSILVKKRVEKPTFEDLDVGASRLIIDEKIKLKQGHEISELSRELVELELSADSPAGHFTEHSIVFDDDHEIDADIVVLATGYKVRTIGRYDSFIRGGLMSYCRT